MYICTYVRSRLCTGAMHCDICQSSPACAEEPASLRFDVNVLKVNALYHRMMNQE